MALITLTHLFLKEFIERDQGRILNVSSIASLIPGPYMAVYYASKAFITSFTNALAEELRGAGVTATALLPGATNTNFGIKAGIVKTRIFRDKASPTDVARAGYEGMIKGKLNVITGLSIAQRVLVPLIPLVPKRTMLKVIRKLHEPKQRNGMK